MEIGGKIGRIRVREWVGQEKGKSNIKNEKMKGMI